ncbi:MAG: 2-C-methyl-D-erythritol 4-phosphate cytidylyltransferase [Prevotella sp.]|nr:2-C-methyl-D-erythritol 4-phosphate cytidylyltransferase [Prevotella sp.]MCM1075265.1 2-C-methyl-D-erythritol 4-phosphate cytidylyltransferase [Ruminococcus sp.]
MKKVAVIVAGGSGLRAGGGIPKQLQDLAGRHVFAWSVKAFLEEDSATRIILVVNGRYRDMFESALANMQIEFPPFDCKTVEGGTTRAESVMHALALLEPEDDLLIAVHDAARPLVSVDMVRRGWQTALKHGAAVPCVPLADSIRRLNDDGTSESVPRSDYVAVQTPQVFKGNLLIKAYLPLKEGKISVNSVTDDASVVELSGCPITLYSGDTRNIKITNPQDLTIANTIL